MKSSLQRRISLGVVANTAGVVLIAAIVIWFANRGWLLQGLDRDLQSRAERMHRFDALPAGEWRPRPWLMPETKADADERIDLRRPVLVMDAANGGVLMRASQLPADFTARLNPSNRGLQTVHLKPDLHLRLLAVLLQRGLPMDAAENRPVILFLASDLSPIDEELTRMAALLCALWVTASFLAWVSVRWSGRVLLRPIRDLSTALDQLGPDDLASRLPADVGPREFGRRPGRGSHLRAAAGDLGPQHAGENRARSGRCRSGRHLGVRRSWSVHCGTLAEMARSRAVRRQSGVRRRGRLPRLHDGSICKPIGPPGRCATVPSDNLQGCHPACGAPLSRRPPAWLRRRCVGALRQHEGVLSARARVNW